MASSKSVCELGLIPGELTLSVPAGTGFRMGRKPRLLDRSRRAKSHICSLPCFFMARGCIYLGNMWFLWIFGNNIEDSMGRLRFILFYLLCGLAAAMGQVLTSPNSPIPMVGASGAISGVMGAYLMLFPQGPCLRARPDHCHLHLSCHACLGHARLLVSDPVYQRARNCRRRCRWRRLLGACRRFSGRSRARKVFRSRRLFGSSPSAQLAAAPRHVQLNVSAQRFQSCDQVE